MLIYFQENWVPRDRDDNDDNDDEYELRQRRALVEQWASASQEFRDVNPLAFPSAYQHCITKPCSHFKTALR